MARKLTKASNVPPSSRGVTSPDLFDAEDIPPLVKSSGLRLQSSLSHAELEDRLTHCFLWAALEGTDTRLAAPPADMRDWFQKVSDKADQLLLAMGLPSDLCEFLDAPFRVGDYDHVPVDSISWIESMPAHEHLRAQLRSARPSDPKEFDLWPIARLVGQAIPSAWTHGSPMSLYAPNAAAGVTEQDVAIAKKTDHVAILLARAPHAVMLIKALADAGRERSADSPKGAGRRPNIFARSLFRGLAEEFQEWFGQLPYPSNGTRTDRIWDGPGIPWTRAVIQLAWRRAHTRGFYEPDWNAVSPQTAAEHFTTWPEAADILEVSQFGTPQLGYWLNNAIDEIEARQS